MTTPRCRFVLPSTTTLTLSDGHTLIVKTDLTEGDRRAEYARMYVFNPDGDLVAHPQQLGVAKVVAYLLDWSLTGLDGQPVAIKEKPPAEVQSILDGLHPDDFAEIKQAIDNHEGAQVKARAEEKKTRTGAPPSTPISSSVP